MSQIIQIEKISISERLPEYDHDCIVWFADGIGIYVGSYDKGEWKLSGNNSPAYQEIAFWAHFPD